MPRKISIIVVIVAVLAMGVWYVYRSDIATEELTIAPVATTTPQGHNKTTSTSTDFVKKEEPVSASTNTGQYIGMKKYRSDEYGFEFWYPEGWELKDKTELFPRSDLYLSVTLEGDYTLTMDSFSIVIASDEFADHAMQGEKVSQMAVSGIPAKKYTYTLEGVSATVIDVPIRGQRMLISAQTNHEKELDAIVSTLVLK